MGGLLGNESLEPSSKPALQRYHPPLQNPSREAHWNPDPWLEELSRQATYSVACLHAYMHGRSTRMHALTHTYTYTHRTQTHTLHSL